MGPAVWVLLRRRHFFSCFDGDDGDSRNHRRWAWRVPLPGGAPSSLVTALKFQPVSVFFGIVQARDYLLPIFRLSATTSRARRASCTGTWRMQTPHWLPFSPVAIACWNAQSAQPTLNRPLEIPARLGNSEPCCTTTPRAGSGAPAE